MKFLTLPVFFFLSAFAHAEGLYDAELTHSLCQHSSAERAPLEPFLGAWRFSRLFGTSRAEGTLEVLPSFDGLVAEYRVEGMDLDWSEKLTLCRISTGHGVFQVEELEFESSSGEGPWYQVAFYTQSADSWERRSLSISPDRLRAASIDFVTYTYGNAVRIENQNLMPERLLSLFSERPSMTRIRVTEQL